MHAQVGLLVSFLVSRPDILHVEASTPFTLILIFDHGGQQPGEP